MPQKLLSTTKTLLLNYFLKLFLKWYFRIKTGSRTLELFSVNAILVDHFCRQSPTRCIIIRLPHKMNLIHWHLSSHLHLQAQYLRATFHLNGAFKLNFFFYLKNKSLKHCWKEYGYKWGYWQKSNVIGKVDIHTTHAASGD